MTENLGGILLAIVYIGLFVLLISRIIRCANTDLGWSKLFCFEGILLALSILVLVVFESLPTGDGPFSGFRYFIEIISSVFAFITYLLTLIVTIIIKFSITFKKDNRYKKHSPPLAIVILVVTIILISVFLMFFNFSRL